MRRFDERAAVPDRACLIVVFKYADQRSNGVVLKNAVSYQRIAETMGLPRESI